MQATACYTLVLKFVPPAGKVCGVATHAVGGDAGYGLLKTDSQFSDDLFIMCYLSKM